MHSLDAYMDTNIQTVRAGEQQATAICCNHRQSIQHINSHTHTQTEAQTRIRLSYAPKNRFTLGENFLNN